MNSYRHNNEKCIKSKWLVLEWEGFCGVIVEHPCFKTCLGISEGRNDSEILCLPTLN